MVVHVRTVPRSRTNPQYTLDALPMALAACQIRHTGIEELGGLRSKSTDVPPEVNGWWENQSFHNYADYAMSDEFRRGLAQLVDLGRERRVAMLCSEAVWWRCHRRIVPAYPMARGEAVVPTMGTARGEREPAEQSGREQVGRKVANA